jgi:crotonobetainyl-CoA:carnitine CoA-transferase CaiB-like acyl-CoA transferase
MDTLDRRLDDPQPDTSPRPGHPTAPTSLTLPSHDAPLAGIRVLDLSRLLPGPYCTQLLAESGAEVIKVETPLAGDYARMAPPQLGFGGIFESVNRGKRSLAVDYRRPEGRDLLLRLAETADVFLESSRPGQLARRGLGPVEVRDVNHAIVYCSLSGFGQTGPYRDRPAHDIDFLAVSGLLSLLGPSGASPSPPGLQLADIAAGMLAATRITSALVARERTGQGCYLDLGVLDAVVGWLRMLGAGVASAGPQPGPMSGAYPCYRAYQAADGRWLVVGALEPPFWSAFCRGLDRHDLVARQYDPSASTEVAALIAGRDSSAWLARFEPDACVAPVNLPREALADRQTQIRMAGVPALAPAPRLGSDTNDILAEAAIAPALVRRLTRHGVISGAQSRQRAARAARLGSLLARMAEHDRAPAA